MATYVLANSINLNGTILPAGKLTATAPSGTGDVVAQVGICLDNANYAGAKTAKVLLQVKNPVQL